MGKYVQFICAAFPKDIGVGAASRCIANGFYGSTAIQTWAWRYIEESRYIRALRFRMCKPNSVGGKVCTAKYSVVVHTGFQYWLGRSSDNISHDMASGAHGLGVERRHRESYGAFHS